MRSGQGIGHREQMKTGIQLVIFVGSLMALYAMRTGNDLPGDRETRIPVNRLTGQWQTLDTPVCAMTLVRHLSELVLQLHATQEYYFGIDSNGALSSGYAPNWPPYNANLKLLGEDTLEITYSQLGVPDQSVRYVRKKHRE